MRKDPDGVCGRCSGTFTGVCPECLGTGQGRNGWLRILMRAAVLSLDIFDHAPQASTMAGDIGLRESMRVLRRALGHAYPRCADLTREKREREAIIEDQARQLRSGVSLAQELAALDVEREFRRLTELADNSASMRKPTGGWFLGPSLSEEESSFMDVVKPLFITIAILVGLTTLAIAAYGLYLAFMAGLIMGLVALFFQPAPFVIGLVALLTGTDLAAALVRLLAT